MNILTWKKTKKTLAWTVLLGLFLSTVSALADDKKSIEITAQAERSIEPDELGLNIEIWSKAATAQRVQALAADEQKRVMGILDQFKIRKEDIQTLSYNFGPEYVWDQARRQNRLVGFQATQTLRVTLKAIAQGGKFLDALSQSSKGGTGPNAEAGVNLNSIQWESSKRREVEKAALADAVREARERAEELAKAAGVKIKGVLRMSHFAGDSGSRPVFAKMRGEMAMAADSGGGVSLAEGQIKVRVSVAVDYEI